MPRLLLDLLVVSLFALAGRRSHDASLTAAGWWETAWPFLAGVVLGWLLALAVRRPPGSVTGGTLVWMTMVAAAMSLRALTGAGTAWPFILVATSVTGVLLLGTRLVAVVLARRSGVPERS